MKPLTLIALAAIAIGSACGPSADERREQRRERDERYRIAAQERRDAQRERDERENARCDGLLLHAERMLIRAKAENRYMSAAERMVFQRTLRDAKRCSDDNYNRVMRRR